MSQLKKMVASVFSVVPSRTLQSLAVRLSARKSVFSDVGLSILSQVYRYKPRRVTRVVRGAEFDLDTADIVQRYMALFATWEPNLTAEFEEHLADGDIVVDVGANVGYYTQLAATLVGNNGTVVGIEPNPAFSEGLHTLAAAHSAIRIRDVAVGSSAGVASLYLGPAENQGHASLVPDSTHGESVEIEVTTLDSLIESEGIDAAELSLLKIDVEGFEEEVVLGAERTLDKASNRLLLVIECASRESEKKIVDLLSPLGFSGRQVHNSYKSFRYRTSNVVDPDPYPCDLTMRKIDR